MKRAAAIASTLLAFLLLFTAAGLFNLRLYRLRGGLHLTQAAPAENLPPALAFTTIAFGGFRGLLADALWLRAGKLQEEGRFFELVQLAGWITRLQPRSADVWAYQSWNLAYNIPALLTDPEEKWRWVQNGIRLLQEEGLRLNPGSARLHAELAWLYLHKLGTDNDPAAGTYRTHLRKHPPAIPNAADQRAVETALGVPLDWSTPQAHAIYWAYSGLPHARHPTDDLALRRIVYQALLQLLAAGHEQYRAPAITFIQQTLQHHPSHPALQTLLSTLQP